MATQQFGYGRTAWDVADQLVVRIPTLNQPGGAAPQFKENKYTALAAKSIGEMLYNQSQKSNAEKKKAFEKQKQDKIKAKQAKLQKDTNVIYGSAFNALENIPNFKNAKEDSTKVYNKQKVKGNEESEVFVPSNATDLEKFGGRSDELKSYTSRLDAATLPALERYKENKYTFDFNMKQDRKTKHLDNEAYLKWALKAGDTYDFNSSVGAHFMKDGVINYNLLEQYEKSPLEYWKTNIRGKE